MLTIKHVGYATKDYALCQQNNFVCLIKTIFLSWFTRNTKNWNIVF